MVIALLVTYWSGHAYPALIADRVAQVELQAEQLARVLEGLLVREADGRIAVGGDKIALMETLGRRAGVLKIKLFDRDGTTLYSSDVAEIGEINEHDYFHRDVVGGNRFSTLVRTNEHTRENDSYPHDVVETYIPVLHDEQVTGAFEIYLDTTDQLRNMALFGQALNRDLGLAGLLIVGFFSLLAHQGHRAALREQQERNHVLAQEVVRRREVEDRLRENERRYDHMAHHDPLTGLPNRRLFADRLEHALALAKREQSRVALLFIDLDHFKKVNDSLGHGVGDRLLIDVCALIGSALRQCDTIAHMGGDEFTILVEQIAAHDEITALAERILRVLEAPIRVGEYELRASASIGVAIAPEDGSTPEELLMNADTAMYRAKERGRNGYQYYMPELNARAEARLQIESSIVTAIEEEQFVVHYQPQIELASGRMVGVEALIRWEHPTLGTISPADFIPIAEETGLIMRIGEWVLREATRAAGSWRRELGRELRVAVNLSARQFHDRGLHDKVLSALDEAALPPHCLELELTESLVMQQPETAARLLRRFRAEGITASIDDFGTGYSSLSYLRSFPISRLKIDRSFVADIDDPDDAKIVATIINLASGLGVEVIAEGIEKKSQLDYLAQRGCQLGQGFYFARPMPAAELVLRMREEIAHDMRRGCSPYTLADEPGLS